MPKKSPVKPQRRYSKLYNRFRLLTLNHNFNVKIVDLRSSYGIPNNGFQSYDEYVKRDLNLLPIVYKAELTILRRKCDRFSAAYDHLFEHYFLYNKIDYEAPFALATFGFHSGDGKPTTEPEYYIRIYPETTGQDIDSALQSFRLYLDFRNVEGAPYRPNDYLDRDIRIVELSREGRLPEIIIKDINSSFPHEPIENSTKSNDYLEDRRRKLEEQIENLYLE